MSQLNLCCCSIEGLAPLELLVQHPWCRYVDEDGPENMTGMLCLAKLSLEGGDSRQLSLGCGNTQKNMVAFLGPQNVTGMLKMALGSWLRGGITGKPTVSERLQN